MIIDADSHYIPLDVYRFVPDEFKSKLPKYTKDDVGRLKVILDVDPTPESLNPLEADFHNRYIGFYDPEIRLSDFESMGIDFQILNPQEHAMRFNYSVEPELAKWMAYSYNRVLLETIQKYPNKYDGPILLPLQDLEWCLQEMEWAKKNNLNSIMLDTAWPKSGYVVADPIISFDGMDRIFQKANELDMLISFHHQMHQQDFRQRKEYRNLKLQYLLPSHQKMLAISLITSGLLDKYPDSKVLISEGGMKFIKESYKYSCKIMNKECVDYFRKNMSFTIETEETSTLLECIELFGSESFLFATDYPHDDPGGQMKFVDHKLIKEIGLDQKHLENICYKNAVKLFNLRIQK